MLVWPLYCKSIDEAATEFHWQQHHEEAVRGKLVIFPAFPSHIHRSRVNDKHSKTIATSWINAGAPEGCLNAWLAPETNVPKESFPSTSLA